MHRSDASLYVPKQDNFVLVMQDVMVTGLASMASVSRLRMAATFAIVRLDGMVQSAIYQVLEGGSQSCVSCDSMTSTASSS